MPVATLPVPAEASELTVFDPHPSENSSVTHAKAIRGHASVKRRLSRTLAVGTDPVVNLSLRKFTSVLSCAPTQQACTDRTLNRQATNRDDRTTFTAMCFGSSPLDPMSIIAPALLTSSSRIIRLVCVRRRRVCMWTLQPSDRRSCSSVWQNTYRAILSRAVAGFAADTRGTGRPYRASARVATRLNMGAEMVPPEPALFGLPTPT